VKLKSEIAFDRGLRKDTFNAMAAMNNIKANESSVMAICRERFFIADGLWRLLLQ
jgi:hypothetical protein